MQNDAITLLEVPYSFRLEDGGERIIIQNIAAQQTEDEEATTFVLQDAGELTNDAGTPIRRRMIQRETTHTLQP